MNVMELFSSPPSIDNKECLLDWLEEQRTLKGTRKRDASKTYARLHTPMVCECGCNINRGLILQA